MILFRIKSDCSNSLWSYDFNDVRKTLLFQFEQFEGRSTVIFEQFEWISPFLHAYKRNDWCELICPRGKNFFQIFLFVLKDFYMSKPDFPFLILRNLCARVSLLHNISRNFKNILPVIDDNHNNSYNYLYRLYTVQNIYESKIQADNFKQVYENVFIGFQNLC